MNHPRFAAFPLMPIAVGLLALFMAGCEQKMAKQPRYDPYEASVFFEDGQSARPLPPGTVARGGVHADTHLDLGIVDGAPAKEFPFPVDLAVLERGRERYNIFCAPCHSRTGDGDGMIARRGFTRPPSLHIDRLRQAPVGHLFHVITRGMGAMPDYRYQLPPGDRWAVIAYIQALQLSQHASFQMVPAKQQAELKSQKP